MTNLERSMGFYRDVLGADLLVGPHDGTSPSFIGRMAILSLGGCIFDLYEHSGNGGERFHPTRTGLDHFALTATSLDELHAWATVAALVAYFAAHDLLAVENWDSSQASGQILDSVQNG